MYLTLENICQEADDVHKSQRDLDDGSKVSARHMITAVLHFCNATDVSNWRYLIENGDDTLALRTEVFYDNKNVIFHSLRCG
jgi:hypothetical protein